MTAHPTLNLMDVRMVLGPLAIAVAFILLCSLLREPNRRQFSALMIAGASAAYFNGGLGPWELAFCALLRFMAYRGLVNYRYIAVAWVFHTTWDVIHDVYANPIIGFAPKSSAGCAVCDLGLALWYAFGAPSPYDAWRRRRAARRSRIAAETT